MSVVHPPLLHSLEHVCRALSSLFINHAERTLVQQTACRAVILHWNEHHKNDPIIAAEEYERYAERKGWPYNF